MIFLNYQHPGATIILAISDFIAIIGFVVLLLVEIKKIRQPNEDAAISFNGQKFDSSKHLNAKFSFLLYLSMIVGLIWCFVALIEKGI